MTKTISLKQVLFLFLAALTIYASSLLVPSINRQRDELTLNPVLENAPPELELATKVLAGFRGIITDVLWLRAQSMMMDGRYFEMAQLHDWIAVLEPRIPEVWAYSAWNMAYNISVEMPTAEERWYWINKAIEYLRDKGIPWNQNSAELYRELAWIYVSKIGQAVDEYHKEFKYFFALEMWNVLGSENPDFKAFASAPKTRKELLEDKAVAAYVDEFSKLKTDILGDDFFKLSRSPDLFSEELRSVFESEKFEEARKRIDVFMRAKRLKEKYKLDPEIIVKIMYGDPDSPSELDKTGYGELDWRLPEPHALYWAKKSLDVATSSDFVANYDRIVFFAINQSFRRGKLIMDPDAELMMVMSEPDFRFIPKLDEIHSAMVKKYAGQPQENSMQEVHRNFLMEAAMIYYTYNMSGRAADCYERARSLYGYKSSDFENLTIDELILTRIREQFVDFPSLEYAQNFILGLTNQSFWWLASGEYDLATGYRKKAMMIHTEYNKSKREKAKDTNPERRTLPPFAAMEEVAKARAFSIFPEVMQERLQDALGLTDNQVKEYKEGLAKILKRQAESRQQRQENQQAE